MKVQERFERFFAHRVDGKKIIVKTKSFLIEHDESMGLPRWANCLYIQFLKNDFPSFSYPIDGNYYQSSFSKVDFHKGITFYEEKIIENRMIVTIGCDYQHYGDESYGSDDNGKLILINDGLKSLDSFLALYKEVKNECGDFH